MRNVVKQADIGRASISDKRGLTAGELNQIFTIYKEKTQTTGSHLDGLWDAIGTAFYMGYAVGRRDSKA